QVLRPPPNYECPHPSIVRRRAFARACAVAMALPWGVAGSYTRLISRIVALIGTFHGPVYRSTSTQLLAGIASCVLWYSLGSGPPRLWVATRNPAASPSSSRCSPCARPDHIGAALRAPRTVSISIASG